MALAVVKDNEIIVVESSSSVNTAISHADGVRKISGRGYREVERTYAGIEYTVHRLDESDVKILSDKDRYYDPKYVNYVKQSCPVVGAFAVR